MTDQPTAEIAPTGRLRVAIATAPLPSAFFARVDEATGTPKGVTVDLGTALARELGLPLALVVYPNSGELTAAGPKNEWDVAFMPVDAERKKLVDFGPAYFLIESTYLVRPGSGITSMAEIDRADIVVGAIDGTTTGRSARRTLAHAQMRNFRSVDDMLASLHAGEIAGMALSREMLTPFVAKMPGSRVLDGHFQVTGIAIAVPQGRPQALALATDFIERAKASGLVRDALARVGFDDASIAPPGARF